MVVSDRRRFIRGAGVIVLGATLAGCGEPDPEPEPEPEAEPEPEPEPDGPDARLDAFLTENDANLYDGTIEDRTGEDEVTVAVGAGDGFAFDPPAIRIEAGTTIVWEWTGDGGVHNVVPDGDTDFDDFGDDDMVDEAGHTVSDTFDEPGVGMYVCTPHRGLNMFGGFVVE